MNPRPIVYYISAHGYGHGVRSCDILRTFRALYPQIPVIVVSMLPRRFFHSRLPHGSVALREAEFDVGLVQTDAVRADISATLERLTALYSQKKKILEKETSFLSACGAAMVVTDIPGMPLEAAARLKIPGVAVGNFSWDWIYRPFAEEDARWWPLVEDFEAAYAQADLLLRLPFHGPMQAFRRVEDVPLVGRPGHSRRSEITRSLRIKNQGRKWVLLSFTALEWEQGALERIAALKEYEFFAVDPVRWQAPNVHTLDARRFSFRDIVASVDVVVSKPGYGIVSDCILNNKPLVYTERASFVEYDVLVAAIHRYLQASFIRAEDLYRGELGGGLRAIWTMPSPREKVPRGGDEIIARRIRQYTTS